jgi:prevent-host-death family protein
MTKSLSISDVQQKLPGLLALADDGDEIIIEENGEPVATVSPIRKTEKPTKRTSGLGKDTIWISDDFDDELPDEFWGFDKEL